MSQNGAQNFRESSVLRSRRYKPDTPCAARTPTLRQEVLLSSRSASVSMENMGKAEAQQPVVPVFFLSFVLCIALWKLSRLSSKENDKESDCPKEVALDTVAAPFPWEPRVDERNEADKPKETPRNHVMSAIASEQWQKQQQQQLEFLASMTFAGGTLRAPSCPCCQ